jgi:hypothetical protein
MAFASRKYSININLPERSPSLSVLRSEINSTISIFNRISFIVFVILLLFSSVIWFFNFELYIPSEYQLYGNVKNFIYYFCVNLCIFFVLYHFVFSLAKLAIVNIRFYRLVSNKISLVDGLYITLLVLVFMLFVVFIISNIYFNYNAYILVFLLYKVGLVFLFKIVYSILELIRVYLMSVVLPIIQGLK